MGYGNYSLEAHEAIVSSRDTATMTFAAGLLGTHVGRCPGNGVLL